MSPVGRPATRCRRPPFSTASGTDPDRDRPPDGVQLDETWRDGVYHGPRMRVNGWGVADELAALAEQLRIDLTPARS